MKTKIVIIGFLYFLICIIGIFCNNKFLNVNGWSATIMGLFITIYLLLKPKGDEIERIRGVNHIIVNSVDYNDLQRDIQELKEDIQNASSDEIKLKKSEKLSEKQQQLESLKESVYRLHETFNKIPINTERLQKAKACFDAGKFREADALLKHEEMASELEKLQAAEIRKEQELNKIRKGKEDISNEYLIKAQIWATFYSEPGWYNEVIK